MTIQWTQRKLVVPGLPYLVVYSIEPAASAVPASQTVVILRVLHGAMLWPPAEE